MDRLLQYNSMHLHPHWIKHAGKEIYGGTYINRVEDMGMEWSTVTSRGATLGVGHFQSLEIIRGRSVSGG